MKNILLIVIVVVFGDGCFVFFFEFYYFIDVLVRNFRYRGVKRNSVVGMYFE